MCDRVPVSHWLEMRGVRDNGGSSQETQKHPLLTGLLIWLQILWHKFAAPLPLTASRTVMLMGAAGRGPAGRDCGQAVCDHGAALESGHHLCGTRPRPGQHRVVRAQARAGRPQPADGRAGVPGAGLPAGRGGQAEGESQPHSQPHSHLPVLCCTAAGVVSCVTCYMCRTLSSASTRLSPKLSADTRPPS